MASTTDIALFKKHVRADDFTEDDNYLGQLYDTAEDWVVSATNRKKEDLVDSQGHLPRPLVQAVLMLAGHWYNQREAVSNGQMTEVPYTIDALIKPFRKLS